MIVPAPAPLQRITEPLLQDKKVTLYLKREDLLHPHISGNKWRKLKYNLQEAQNQQKSTLLTFGGAYSNHIAAVAAAGREFQFKTIGFIRGEPHETLNPTLAWAQSCGMQLHYLDRTTYRQKQEVVFLENLKNQYPNAYVLPEGGTNLFAIKGCTEIVEELMIVPFDYICCAAGTGGTLAGLIVGVQDHGQILGFPALKGGEFLKKDIANLIKEYNGQEYANWQLQTNYHFGGYAKVKPELLAFIQGFKKKHHIPLEPIYTGKMLYGIYDLVRQNFFEPGSTVIAIHTGGLQGLPGFNPHFGLETQTAI
ncbi:1-aminocyclopropane-1-carboxylate deaminase/D-cysteine desulfhydrase [Adhaeribacter pallidiroseus]|uniref:1-aminocyclopropane-1-carboxylate deaminase n=1 Tax=Adhaeribacter pallidiroseus TaxID=2072847 RepID=A0A369QUE1_9BACT|nr:pyridoxal-phosphate dependent enzyme [Adhaeribacter pallidiroseus]RDC66419.1 1-aminocyclopropane-1-carboxylate deaminase [Adhaeribacter pallidiroseus]